MYNYRHRLVFLFSLILFLVACTSDKDRATIERSSGSVCAILAHPDDETIIGGTLAMLSRRGFELTIVYLTSGDDGPDMTGRGLHGKTLAEVREKEAESALLALGISTSPVFLRFPDGHVNQYLDSVQQTLEDLLEKKKPQIVISFGSDGITGDWDHMSTGMATDKAFDQTDSGSLLLHMAITKPLPPFYANGVAVPKDSVDLRVKVSGYSRERVLAVEAHQTQFNKGARTGYKVFVPAMRKEKFSIARNRDGNECLEKIKEWQRD